MARRWAAAAITAAIVGASPSAAALDFSRTTDAQGRAVLVIHDRDPDRCETGCGFTKGDRQRLERVLAGASFYEVWLNSGGGNLFEGVQIGRLLRERRMRVRVPDGFACASACTVAFMGGIVRTIDPKGLFQVHSASVVLHGIDASLKASLMGDPQLALAKLADEQYDMSKSLAHTLISYFQGMLNGRADEAALRRALNVGPARLPYVTNGDLERDARKIRAEQSMVLQEIVMSLERQGIAQAIENVRPSIPMLGPRAAPAVKMLETMYTSSILGTADLSQQTLYELGYVNVRRQR